MIVGKAGRSINACLTEFPDCAAMPAKNLRDDFGTDPKTSFQAGNSNMLVAKREPFELGAPDRLVPHPAPAPTSSRFTRALNILQLLGALVAVPAGIGSAYTMYKTNFSPEASCQSLRHDIIAMLDRGVDASTGRVLVRHDVEVFEQTCGSVDPDTTAAFKTLLAADKAAPAVAATPAPQHTAVRKIETAPVVKSDPAKAEPAKAEVAKSEAAKSEPASAAKSEPAPAKAKPPVAHASTAATTTAQPQAPVSDAAWVAAVRSALVDREQHAAHADVPAPAAPTSLAPPPGVLGELHAPQALPTPPLAAPALPPPAAVATVNAPQADPDHPVPPGAIPDAAPPDATKKPSRIGELVGEIPFFGKSLADRVSR